MGIITEWQAGYDEGRRMGTKHMYAEVDRLKRENEALRKAADELRRAAECHHLNHFKDDLHDYDEPCKVLARIDKALSKEG